MAANYLRRKGYILIGANYRCRFGEIDLIARQEEFLVFVEVKLRKDDDFAEALEFVHRKKQQRIKCTAELYIQQHQFDDLQPRFDVIEVYAPQADKTKNPVIRHLEDAFS